MNKLTKEQAIIVTGFTGICCIDFTEFHADVEKRLGYPVFTHQFADKDFGEKINDLYREDFIAICASSEE